MLSRSMLLERIYEEAAPRLAGRRVRGVKIGLELLGVGLDDNRTGVAYTLRGEWDAETSLSLPDPAELVGRPAQEMGRWLLTARNPLERALGLAVCNAVVEPDPALFLADGDAADAVAARPSDTVGLIGRIDPILRKLEGNVERVVVFDRSQSEGVHPEEQQPELLPQCNLVFITGSALSNGTLESLLQWCTDAREVVLTGPSTPLYPQAFAQTRATLLAGTTWPRENQGAILEQIGGGACYRKLAPLGVKRTMRVAVREG